MIWCPICQWNYWPWVIGRYASDFAWYMSQLILVLYRYCWEIYQWLPWYMSQVVISRQAGVGRYASGYPWYMSQCSIFIVLFLCFSISLMLYLFHLSYQVIETYEVSFGPSVIVPLTTFDHEGNGQGKEIKRISLGTVHSTRKEDKESAGGRF